MSELHTFALPDAAAIAAMPVEAVRAELLRVQGELCVRHALYRELKERFVTAQIAADLLDTLVGMHRHGGTAQIDNVLRQLAAAQQRTAVSGRRVVH